MESHRLFVGAGGLRALDAWVRDLGQGHAPARVSPLVTGHGTHFSLAATPGAAAALARLGRNRPVYGARHVVIVRDLHRLPRREQLDMRMAVEDARAYVIVANALEAAGVVPPLLSRFEVVRCPVLPLAGSRGSAAVARRLRRGDETSLAAGVMEVIERRRLCACLVDSMLEAYPGIPDSQAHAMVSAGAAADERLAQLDHERLAQLDHERFAQLDHERLAQLDHESLAQLDHERLAQLAGGTPSAWEVVRDLIRSLRDIARDEDRSKPRGAECEGASPDCAGRRGRCDPRGSPRRAAGDGGDLAGQPLDIHEGQQQAVHGHIQRDDRRGPGGGPASGLPLGRGSGIIGVVNGGADGIGDPA